MAQSSPTRYLTRISKAERRGKIFIDYLRNDPTLHMQSLSARCLGKTLQSDGGKKLPDIFRRVNDVPERQTFAGMEIESYAVRPFGLVGPATPGMDFEHTHLNQRDQSRCSRE